MQKLMHDSNAAQHSSSETPIIEEIAHLHGSSQWDAYWDVPASFCLDTGLSKRLSPSQRDLASAHLAKIKKYYTDMERAGFFRHTAVILASIFSTDYPERPRYPTSAFGAGFSGFDRIDERGWDRAGYTITKDHSQDDWELRSSYQIAYFMALARIFKFPASRLIAYDPCYSIVDVVLLASLGIRALMSKDPDRKTLQKFIVPTLFYAPGAEQVVFTDAIQRADPIQNLVILGGDASWCGKRTEDFTRNYQCIHIPGYIAPQSGESTCGEDNCVQWIPASRVDAFNAARGPASEPAVRLMMMPDGSLEPDD
ncbi:hypothetical protein C8J57DRAFT_1288505 [Mycena rebaudengoi]|nr:hypothetical protein C8J57DRAFT_1288505 [Mycena rebaudengoi]